MRTILLALLTGGAILSGCDEKDTASEAAETGSPEGDDTEPACEEVAAEGCAARTDCAPISGWPAQEVGDTWCVEYSAEATPMSCQDADAGCGDAPYLAASPEDPDTCWWFPNTCIPDGWAKCGGFDKYEECAPE